MAMQKLYGNSVLRDQLDRMQKNHRQSHGILLWGETGLGKKTLAQHIAASLLCTGTEKPCGTCKSCRMLQKGTHPDLCVVPHAGKRGGFSVDTVRTVCTDTATPPNEGKAKCYLFCDCDNMDARAQNLLLKIVEEPPEYVYFCFTAQSPLCLLPTIRSRTISLAAAPLSESECRAALLERGYSQEEAEQAVEAFHGNLGNCVNFLENERISSVVALTKSAIYSIIRKDEYALLQAASAAADQIAMFLQLLDCMIRDAMAKKADPNAVCMGCDRQAAQQLSARLTQTSGVRMHEAVGHAYAAIQANVNTQLLLSALCAELMDA